MQGSFWLLLSCFVACEYSIANVRLVVSRTDLTATGWPISSTIDGTHWGQAARAGFDYCEDHGYSAGFLEGNEWAESFGVICFETNRVKIFVPSGLELANSGFGLMHSDLNANSWPVAHRAAQRYCEAQGFQMGFPNGHQFNGRYGIVCTTNPGTQIRMAVKTSLLNTTGWHITSEIKNTTWGVAARASQALCENLGYTSGWMDGHEFMDRKGLLCSK